jgi:hypothetical protein
MSRNFAYAHYHNRQERYCCSTIPTSPIRGLREFGSRLNDAFAAPKPSNLGHYRRAFASNSLIHRILSELKMLVYKSLVLTMHTKVLTC